MTTHRYERSSIAGDFVRGGFGLLVTAGPLLFMPMVTWLAVAFGAFALLFAVYLFRAWQRSVTVIEVDDVGIRASGPFGRAIRWDALDGMQLRYFATRRDKEGGWMQLRLRGGGSELSLESTLDDFEAVAERAARAASGNRLALSDTTQENLKALGLSAGAGVPRETASGDDGRVGMG
ncbi:hypothetical protein BAL199_10612 [alpha proteobacterium BAL199]|nr:hypothetical protein BAL199_10612 [alpha proteobacterium BAL199]